MNLGSMQSSSKIKRGSKTIAEIVECRNTKKPLKQAFKYVKEKISLMWSEMRIGN